MLPNFGRWPRSRHRVRAARPRAGPGGLPRRRRVVGSASTPALARSARRRLTARGAVLVVGAMVRSHEQRERRGREATSSALRWLAACLAFLLVASSLGQIGHFLLVSHAICAEHGELLELSGSDPHA